MKVVVGKVSDFENGDRKIIEVNGKSIGVFRVDDRFYALRNRCPHQFGPLCAGTLAPRAISGGPGDVAMDAGPPLLACPWHGWEYDIATGQSFMGPGRGNVPALAYDVRVLQGSELVPGPYVAETVPVSVEQDYVVVDDSPARPGKPGKSGKSGKEAQA
jgi:nitrite reductase/ring-hydroxylating ferredoxin subunit